MICLYMFFPQSFQVLTWFLHEEAAPLLVTLRLTSMNGGLSSQ